MGMFEQCIVGIQLLQPNNHAWHMELILWGSAKQGLKSIQRSHLRPPLPARSRDASVDHSYASLRNASACQQLEVFGASSAVPSTLLRASTIHVSQVAMPPHV